MIDWDQPLSRRTFALRCVVSSASVVLLTSCGGDQSTATQAPPDPTRARTRIPTASVPDPTETSEAEELPQPVLRAVQAGAEEAGVEPGAVRITSFTERDWPSTALGCPQPGFSYAQVVTPGYEVLLLIEDQEYAYHTNMASTVVLCTGGE